MCLWEFLVIRLSHVTCTLSGVLFCFIFKKELTDCYVFISFNGTIDVTGIVRQMAGLIFIS